MNSKSNYNKRQEVHQTDPHSHLTAEQFILNTMTTNTPEAIWEKIQKGVFIIAEAGKIFIQTEEGRPLEEYLANAKELVDKAAGAGADRADADGA